MVLSGMSNMSQLKENIEIFKDLKPLSQQGEEAALQIRAILEQQNRIDCTNCRYCVETCPQFLPIRQLLKDVADLFEQD